MTAIGADDDIQYATATFKVLNAYAGWSGVNYVLNNVRNPVRTLKIAGPLGLGICATLYILANIAYFSAATRVRRPPIRYCPKAIGPTAVCDRPRSSLLV